MILTTVKEVDMIGPRVYKHFSNGWTAESRVFNLNGHDWDITTLKRSSGYIVSKAQACKFGNKKWNTSMEFTMFSDPSLKLIECKKRATQNSVTDLHKVAILKFLKLAEQKELPGKTNPGYEIKVGHIIYFDSIQNGSGQKVVYQIEEVSRMKKRYLFIDLEKMILGSTDRVRNFKEKFGIGYYYNEGEYFSDTKMLFDKVEQARQLEADRRDQERIDKENAAIQRASDIEKGRTILNIPKGVTHVIVADLKEDKSDPHTDYFASRTVDTVYLAFSSHRRQLFPELRRAALRFDQTIDLASADEKVENRDYYYWIGNHPHRGWQVRKEELTDQIIDDLYVAAAQGKYLCESNDCNNHDKEDNSSPLFIAAQTIHSKKGHHLYVATLKEEVERQTFLSIRTRAKTYNGYYSSYKKDGAIPGFQFLTQQDRDQFIKSFI